MEMEIRNTKYVMEKMKLSYDRMIRMILCYHTVPTVQAKMTDYPVPGRVQLYYFDYLVRARTGYGVTVRVILIVCACVVDETVPANVRFPYHVQLRVRVPGYSTTG